MRKFITLFLLLALTTQLHSAPIHIKNKTDYKILDRFFKAMVEQSEYGYVLEGVKPISIEVIHSMDDLLVPQTLRYTTGILAREAISLWQHIQVEESDIILKATPIDSSPFAVKPIELLFVHVPLLKQEIETNINLFRYVLGPHIPDAAYVVDYILKTPKPLSELLKEDNVLMGIVLGFGAYNSLMQSRAEGIQSARKDVLPFMPHSTLMKSTGPCQHSDLLLRTHFLSTSGDFQTHATEQHLLQPSIGFNNCEEELKFIKNCQEETLETLLKEKPRFVFGAYKQPENLKLEKRLADAQKQVKTLLVRQDFLETVLQKITGESPIIDYSSIASKNISLDLEESKEEIFAQILWDYCSQIGKEYTAAFLESFYQGDSLTIALPKLRIMPGTLKGLRQAKINLQLAEAKLQKWKTNRNLKEIIPDHLYFEELKPGDGTPLGTADSLLLSYIIEDGEENVLTAAHKTWLSLSTVIPGFAHGIKDMKVGETRVIYVHPALAYGALTTLPLCTPLVIKAILHQVNTSSLQHLPSAEPIDLSWINDPEFFQEVSVASSQLASVFGNRWGCWLSKSTDLDFSKLCDCLKHLAKTDAQPNPTKIAKKELVCNRVLWNLLVDKDDKP